MSVSSYSTPNQFIDLLTSMVELRSEKTFLHAGRAFIVFITVDIVIVDKHCPVFKAIKSVEESESKGWINYLFLLRAYFYSCKSINYLVCQRHRCKSRECQQLSSRLQSSSWYDSPPDTAWICRTSYRIKSVICHYFWIKNVFYFIPQVKQTKFKFPFLYHLMPVQFTTCA